MNPVIDSIFEYRSIRAYRPDPIPDEDPDRRARLPTASIVHREEYEPFDDARIHRTYDQRETEGWERYMSFPELAERIRSSGVKNLAQVYTQLKYTRENNEQISSELIRALEKQGFLSGR